MTPAASRCWGCLTTWACRERRCAVCRPGRAGADKAVCEQAYGELLGEAVQELTARLQQLPQPVLLRLLEVRAGGVRRNLPPPTPSPLADHLPLHWYGRAESSPRGRGGEALACARRLSEEGAQNRRSRRSHAHSCSLSWRLTRTPSGTSLAAYSARCGRWTPASSVATLHLSWRRTPTKRRPS